MKTNSIWTSNISLGKTNKLTKDIELDVLIIGGGITGLSTAYHLMNKNLKVALVERNKIGMGITSRSTAKITFLQENIYSKLKKNYDEEISRMYLNSQIEAINTIKDIIKNNKIDCDFNKVDSYLFTNDQEKIKDVKDEKKLLEKFSIKTKEVTELPDKEKIKYGFSVSNTYVFHPIKYLISLKNILIKNNVDVYEDSKVLKIDRENNNFICLTDKATIKAKKVIITTHYPYFLFPFMMPLKCSLEKSYIGVERVFKDYGFSAINTSIPTKSIRYHKDNDKIYKINLINSHNIAIKNNERENFKELLNNNYEYIWSNHDIITNDNLAFIGEIEKDFMIGTGYNTWGMTNSTIAGKILSDIVLNKENKYIKLFNPKRGLNLSKVLKFPIILSSNIKSFVGSKVNKNKSWYKNVVFKKINGNNVGIYIDEDSNKHIIYNKCPHLGCSLVFNEVEKTWDCPCHGSRFDISGKVITGPSNYDISFKEE
ncbi:MAG: FAD-dependent oxidoreductase [Bacilli bacterium]|nr:FAD-dependent oxidoreductase [Bacilli bacterium]